VEDIDLDNDEDDNLISNFESELDTTTQVESEVDSMLETRLQIDLASETLNFDDDQLDDNLCLKDYVDDPEFIKKKDSIERSPFVKLVLANQTKIVKKSSLCWLFNNNKKLSNDRLLRVRQNPTSSHNISHQIDTENDNAEFVINTEMYYAVYYDTGWYIGRVLEKLTNQLFKIKFLSQNLEVFKWPRKDDIQEVENRYIFYGPINMQGVNSLTISQSDRKLIIKQFKKIKKKF